MKVLLLSPAAGLGGAERSLLDVVLSIRKARPDISLAVLSASEGPLNDILRSSEIEVRVLPFPSRFAKLGEDGTSGLLAAVPSVLRTFATASDLARYAMAFREAVRSFQPDVVHSNGVKMHMLAAVGSPLSIPVLWHVRDFMSFRPISKWMARVADRRVDLAIANSRATRDDLLKVSRRFRTRVVYNGIDTGAFSPGGAVAPLDALAGMPPTECLRVGIVATYARWKGHATFVEAATRVARERSDVRFYIVGGPIYETGSRGQFSASEMHELTHDLRTSGRLGLVPFCDEPADAHRALDIVVHASTRSEPFGRTIVEAMACGRAVVVSNDGGAKELFREGYDALGFEPGDAAKLAAKILRLVDDDELRSSLGERGRETVNERFSHQRLGATLASVYDECATLRSTRLDRQ